MIILPKVFIKYDAVPSSDLTAQGIYQNFTEMPSLKELTDLARMQAALELPSLSEDSSEVEELFSLPLTSLLPSLRE